MATTTPKPPLYRSLYFQVVCAVVAGVALGHFYPAMGAEMKPLGDGFIKLIKMMIAPIIFCTVVIGIAGMEDMKKVGKTGGLALLYFEVVSTFALIIGLVLVNVFQPGAGMNVDASTLDTKSIAAYTGPGKMVGTTDFILNIIPTALVDAFAKGEILQVLLIAVLFGFALHRFGGRGTLVFDFIEKTSHVLFAIVGFIMKLAPIGAFGAMAFTIGTSIYLTMAAVFIAQATNTPMTLTQEITLLAVLLLTSKGAAGITGSGFIVLAATLSAVGTVPVAGLALILGIDRFMSEARALTNLIGNGVATIVVAKWTNELDVKRLHAGLNNETWVEAQEPEVLLDKKTEHMADSHH